VQGFLDGLQAALPVTIRRTADGLVYVDPRR
jgi:ferric-dicitrate binding protein FerR (iron transport regulator)